MNRNHEAGHVREAMTRPSRRRTAPWGIWALAVLGGLPPVLLTLGCDTSCRATLTCPWDVPSGGEEGGGGSGAPLCPDDPKDGPVDESCGVWVSASLGDDAGEGTQAAPVRTIAAAIALASKASFRIYACGEVYSEPVGLPSGTSLFGGFDCHDGWSYAGTAKRVTLQSGVPGVVPLTLLPGDAASLVRDVSVIAADAAAPGGSSIAVLALPDSKADLQRADVTAGDGADGQDGEDGNHNAPPAPSGLPGKPGVAACVMNPAPGGEAVLLACPDGTTSIGGEGGDAGELAANGGGAGVPIPAANPQGLGLGGHGEDLAQGTSCTPGIGGAPGAEGQNGPGAASAGRLTSNGYLGTAGSDGKPGAPGQGGGGGGASAGKATCGAAPHGGASGGSGGTGGCGGRAGKGGQPGGSSIGMASLGSRLTVNQIRIVTGKGGRGGQGGAGQPGGQGGLPAPGGAGINAQDPMKPGCGGGIGGYGANGGHGGGGHGGHSSAMAATKDTLPIYGVSYDFSLGQPGAGGLGGDPASIEQQGDQGVGTWLFVLEP